MNTTSLASRPDLEERVQRGLLALAARTNNLLAIVDLRDLRMLHLNSSGRTMLGLAPDEDIGPLAWTDCIATEFIPRFLSEIIPDVVNGGEWRGDFVLHHRTSGDRLVSMVVMMEAAGGSDQGALAIAATDISEQRRSQASFEAEHTLLRALLDSFPDSIYFKDLASRILRASSYQARKKGMSRPDEMVGKTDFDFFSSEHAQKAYNDEQRIIRTGQALINIEEKETWPDGRVTWVSTSKMPLNDLNGRIIGTFGVSRDITARKETEQRLQVAQKELVEASRLAGMAEIASGVLHNIGNALNTVNTSVAMITELLSRSRLGNLSKATQMIEAHKADLATFLTQDPRGSQLPAYLIQLAATLGAERDSLRREVEQLSRSIEHIKEVVAMQQSYARVSRLVEDVDLATLVDEALYISEMSLNRHGVTVHRDFHPVPRVRVTRHKVLQILVNLIRNSKYAMDETGRVDKDMCITVDPAGDGRVKVVVRDTGVGIPAENMARIFNFGFTTRKNGHGFGLHSSGNAARELGGSLRGESEGVGKGATFTLELPVAPSEPLPPEPGGPSLTNPASLSP